MPRIPCVVVIAFLLTTPATACSLLKPSEIKAALRSTVTKITPTSSKGETGCTYELADYKVILSYFTDRKRGPQAKSIKEDPYIHDLSPGPNVRDYGNIGCKIVDAGTLFATTCNLYQPRWLHIAVQTHGATAVPIDTVKTLLDKASTRFR
jgi:hypothetical protein